MSLSSLTRQLQRMLPVLNNVPPANGTVSPFFPRMVRFTFKTSKYLEYANVKASISSYGDLESLTQGLPRFSKVFVAQFKSDDVAQNLIGARRVTVAGLNAHTGPSLWRPPNREITIETQIPDFPPRSREVVLSKLPVQSGCTIVDLANFIESLGRAQILHRACFFSHFLPHLDSKTQHISLAIPCRSLSLSSKTRLWLTTWLPLVIPVKV